jgi:hypothetical protein
VAAGTARVDGCTANLVCADIDDITEAGIAIGSGVT